MTDDDLLFIASGCRTAGDFVRKLGHASYSTYTNVYKKRLAALGVRFQSGRFKYTDDQFRQAAKGAASISEVARRLGLQATGGGYRTCRNRLMALGIVLDAVRVRGSGVRRPLEDYLVKDGPFITSSSLRKRLIKTGLKPNKCEKCGRKPWWEGAPLPLQLDHVDGDGDNNCLTNLRIMCPNCHTQTLTHSKIKGAAKVRRRC